MKCFLICLSFFFLGSCAIKKLQRPTTAVDLKTGITIKKNSIQLEKGKICYIYTARYDGQLIDQSIFKNVNFSNFFPAKGVSVDDVFRGGASRSAKIDTTISNDFIDGIALQEALINSPNGFQYQFIPQQAFIDKEENLNISILSSKFDLDIIIILKSISLKMKGDANTAYNDERSEPRNVNFGLYSSSTTSVNSYGNILMDYIAVWEIQNLRKNSKQSINQTGRYVSRYYADYSINEEVMLCAKKIGKDFSDLFKK